MSNNKKTDIGKTAKRKFFRVFNDKSTGKRIAFWSILTVAPAFMITEALETDPSTQRAPDAQAKYDSYQKEIATIAASVPKEVFTMKTEKSKSPATLTPAQTKIMTELTAQAKDLSTRVMLDASLSEKDVAWIAYSYYKALGKTIPQDSFHMMSNRSDFVQEIRAEMPVPKTQLEKENTARHIADASSEKTTQEALIYGGVVYVTLLVLMDVLTKVALRYGRRRDDELICEEKEEKFADAKNNLANILKPKDPLPPKR